MIRIEISSERLAQIAQEAAEQVREKGLCKHSLYTQEGEVCAQGAILCAVGVDLTSLEAKPLRKYNKTAHAEAIAMYYEFSNQVGMVTPADYNDRPDVDDEDVISVFEKIAAHHRVDPEFGNTISMGGVALAAGP